MRASATVAAVYGFFLLFAQFAFVELIRAAGRGHTEEKVLLGVMALAGVAAGFITAWRGAHPSMIRRALVAAALSSALAPISGNMPGALAVAALTGSALGVSTVALAALLPGWCGLPWVGLGTGIGYAVCNLPFVFQQSPAHQSWIAAGLAIIGALVMPESAAWKQQGEKPNTLPFPAAVLLFTALVWMDSAAFFIIQHAADLKSATWGAGHLWRNAALHLVFAVISGLCLHRGARRLVPLAAWGLLAVASLCVNSASTRDIAGLFYPAGVSLYSVALVAWPGWLSGAPDSKSAAWRAAWLFAVAGWFGSANGIGMAQTLQRVPAGFIAIAGVVLLLALLRFNRSHMRPALAVAAVTACGLPATKQASPSQATAAQRGRIIYQSEGCIHCHSRYSRPGSPDESIWGPAPDPKTVLAEQPVLIGNRRQGPDLTNIGARRSEAWLKAHFLNPSALYQGSVMPSYAHLFADGRGDDLVRFLKESGIESTAQLMGSQSIWNPIGSALEYDAKALFARHCAACHGVDGMGKGPLANQFLIPPANLRDGPFIRTQAADDLETAIARVIKFGVIGSDMPGHETLTDGEILALARMLREWRH
ncbi:MAG: cbb3-type cytochrome c oxidase subunit II [Luteolibacter sp.]|nr:cbb3-type cytochrome c oxidase subunit II [Luteolibacter sp.]